MTHKHSVLIAGGGFGGIKTALQLSDDDRFDVVLLSDKSEFRYYPELYRAATGGRLAGSSIPLEELLAGKRIRFELGSAQTLDERAKTLTTADKRTFPYDSLVLALGVTTNYFGIDGLSEFSFGIKSQEEAERLKTHLHQQLTDEHRPDLNYVIVGGGPTGIELAGALPEYLHQIMKNHGIRRKKIHIDLIEAAPRLLPRLPKGTARAVKYRLQKLGVNIYLNKVVQGETADELTVSGRPIRSHTVIWTAGVTNHPFFSANHFALMNHGKVGVDAYLQANPDVYVIGDNANTPYSGMAQTAIHDADFVAQNLRRQLDGKERHSYVVKKPITVIPVGAGWAAVCWGRWNFKGRLGWLLRNAADFEAFYDYQPLFQASKQWLTTFGNEEECTICTAATIR